MLYAAPAPRKSVSLLRRTIVYILMVLLGYLIQVCIVPHLLIGGASPHILFVIIGIITVACGKLRAFWVGLIYGLLMEVMLPGVRYMNLALYSLSALFCSFPFADKPIKTLEYNRAIGSSKRELAPWFRTILCTLSNSFIYEAVHLTYIYLSGTPLGMDHIARSAGSILYTLIVGIVLQFPLRRALLGKKDPERTLKSAPAHLVNG